MPLRKKKNPHMRAIVILAIIAILIILMNISFEPVQHIIEITLS